VMGGVVPCALSVSCNDLHALDLLLSSKGRYLQVQLSAYATYNVPNQRNKSAPHTVDQMRPIQRATWWRVQQGDHAPLRLEDGQMRRVLLGEIHLRKGLFSNFTSGLVSLGVRFS
jgi:hypothetical protein